MAIYSLKYSQEKQGWGIACNGNLNLHGSFWDSKKSAQVICDSFNRSERKAERNKRNGNYEGSPFYE
jgi:hypothetical protein